MHKNLEINKGAFIIYKLFNSLFLGFSIGSIFTIYEPLEPSIYSIGGIVLALGMLILARQYEKILNIHFFYRISIMVELVVLALVLGFLIFSYSYQTALFVYIGYQITFIFGSYLVRAETLVLKESSLLTKIDVAKQTGYLLGMSISFLFYKAVEHILEIKDEQEQVYLAHFILLFFEIIVILFLIKGFKYKNKIS